MEADKTIPKEATAEVFGMSTRKHRDRFDEAAKEIREQLEKEAPATIVCLQNLTTKLPRLHTRLSAEPSWLSLGLCRMIGEKHLLREHTAMLTCAPSMRH